MKENQKIIEIIVPPLKLSPEEEKRDFELFRDNFDLIFKYAGTIINTPQLYHCPLGGARIDLAYVWEYYPPLGALVKLWQDGTLVDACDHCRADLCVYRASAFPLSGVTQCVGICRGCRKVSSQSLQSFVPVMSALKYIRANLNKRKVLQVKETEPGVAAASPLVSSPGQISGQIIDQEINPVSMNVLVRRLRKYEAGKEMTTKDEENPPVISGQPDSPATDTA